MARDQGARFRSSYCEILAEILLVEQDLGHHFTVALLNALILVITIIYFYCNVYQNRVSGSPSISGLVW